MVVRLLLWNIGDTVTSLTDLRALLGETPQRRSGLAFAAWVSDESSERFGAVEVWESPNAAERNADTVFRDLLGKDPEIHELFDLEATSSVAPELDQLGLAFA